MVDQRFAVSVHIMTMTAIAAATSEKQKQTLMTSEKLASSIRTNATVVRRTLSKLVEAGLLKSYKGKNGGVELAKPAKDITLKEIYLAGCNSKLVHGPQKSPHKSCVVSCSMSKMLHQVSDDIEAATLKQLSKVHLSELVAQIDLGSR